MLEANNKQINTNIYNKMSGRINPVKKTKKGMEKENNGDKNSNNR